MFYKDTFNNNKGYKLINYYTECKFGKNKSF